MAGRRPKLDLEMQLKSPPEARRFIEYFEWPPSFNDKQAIIDGKEIRFNNMSDADAVAVATMIVEQILIPDALRDKKYLRWEH